MYPNFFDKLILQSNFVNENIRHARPVSKIVKYRNVPHKIILKFLQRVFFSIKLS